MNLLIFQYPYKLFRKIHVITSTLRVFLDWAKILYTKIKITYQVFLYEKAKID